MPSGYWLGVLTMIAVSCLSSLAILGLSARGRGRVTKRRQQQALAEFVRGLQQRPLLRNFETPPADSIQRFGIEQALFHGRIWFTVADPGKVGA